MEGQISDVRCVFSEDGSEVADVLAESFLLFLRQALADGIGQQPQPGRLPEE